MWIIILNEPESLENFCFMWSNIYRKKLDSAGYEPPFEMLLCHSPKTAQCLDTLVFGKFRKMNYKLLFRIKDTISVSRLWLGHLDKFQFGNCKQPPCIVSRQYAVPLRSQYRVKYNSLWFSSSVRRWTQFTRREASARAKEFLRSDVPQSSLTSSVLWRLSGVVVRSLRLNKVSIRIKCVDFIWLVGPDMAVATTEQWNVVHSLDDHGFKKSKYQCEATTFELISSWTKNQLALSLNENEGNKSFIPPILY